jgi:hypothetical protein
METSKGWNQNLMMGLYQKESAFDGGTTMNETNACGMKGYEFDPQWADEIASDKEDVTGTEHGTTQEIISRGFSATYKEAKAKPNSLAGLAALVLGSISTTQDGALSAYAHKITPVAVGTALPSIQVEHKKGGIQYAYTGVKGNTLKISGEANKFLSFEAGLLGSGSREISAAAFVDPVTESWLLMKKMSAWAESGANISITAIGSRVQGAENISSDTPDSIGTRLKSFEINWNNNLEGQAGAGGDGVFQDIDYGRRAADLKYTLLFSGQTELDYYLNQDLMALEFNLKGAKIVEAGTMYYGVDIIVPRFRLKKAPVPAGGVGDTLTAEFECEIFDDGTNSPLEIIVYNAVAAYLAAAA